MSEIEPRKQSNLPIITTYSEEHVDYLLPQIPENLY